MDTSMTEKHTAVSAQGFSRRNLLRGSVALGLGALVSGMLPWQAVLAAEADSDFAALSQFLVSRPVNPVLASRYYAPLSKRAPNFAANVSALKQLVSAQGFTHVDQYLAMANPDASLKATATSIISAWYLGVVGEPADAELVTYSLAMMYQATQGTIIVPTYAIGPATWGPKPVARQGSSI